MEVLASPVLTPAPLLILLFILSVARHLLPGTGSLRLCAALPGLGCSVQGAVIFALLRDDFAARLFVFFLLAGFLLYFRQDRLFDLMQEAGRISTGRTRAGQDSNWQQGVQTKKKIPRPYNDRRAVQRDHKNTRSYWDYELNKLRTQNREKTRNRKKELLQESFCGSSYWT